MSLKIYLTLLFLCSKKKCGNNCRRDWKFCGNSVQNTVSGTRLPHESRTRPQVPSRRLVTRAGLLWNHETVSLVPRTRLPDMRLDSYETILLWDHESAKLVWALYETGKLKSCFDTSKSHFWSRLVLSRTKTSSMRRKPEGFLPIQKNVTVKAHVFPTIWRSLTARVCQARQSSSARDSWRCPVVFY